MDSTRLGKGSSEAFNTLSTEKQATVKRFTKFLDSLEKFHPGQITAIFEAIGEELNRDPGLSENASRVHSELGKLL